jgi:hypothetical protein
MKYIVIFLLIVSQTANATEVLTPWVTSRKTESVELQYRWVMVGDTLKTREMRAVFNVQATPEEIIENFHNSDKIKLWACGSKECRIYKHSNQEWVNYSVFDIPQPLPQQDLVTKYHLKMVDSKTIILITAIPEYLPYKDGVERLQHYEGSWQLIPMGNGVTRVEFSSISYTKPMLPRWLQDKILQPMMINSFENLIKLSQHEVI